MPSCFHRVDPASLRCISCGRHVFDLEDCEMVPIRELDAEEEPMIVHQPNGTAAHPATPINYVPKLTLDTTDPIYKLGWWKPGFNGQTKITYPVFDEEPPF